MRWPLDICRLSPAMPDNSGKKSTRKKSKTTARGASPAKSARSLKSSRNKNDRVAKPRSASVMTFPVQSDASVQVNRPWTGHACSSSRTRSHGDALLPRANYFASTWADAASDDVGVSAPVAALASENDQLRAELEELRAKMGENVIIAEAPSPSQRAGTADASCQVVLPWRSAHAGTTWLTIAQDINALVLEASAEESGTRAVIMV